MLANLAEILVQRRQRALVLRKGYLVARCSPNVFRPKAFSRAVEKHHRHPKARGQCFHGTNPTKLIRFWNDTSQFIERHQAATMKLPIGRCCFAIVTLVFLWIAFEFHTVLSVRNRSRRLESRFFRLPRQLLRNGRQWLPLRPWSSSPFVLRPPSSVSALSLNAGLAAV